MITLQGISKTFRIVRRRAGLGGALRNLLHREYTQVQALSDISFHVSPGEIVGYIGPNGAGKSTTIKVMSGILVPDRGECRIAGFTPWRDRRAYVGRIGVVFGQRTQLWWDVPVVDSFDLLAKIYAVPPARYRENLARMTDILDLGPLLGTPLRQLSLGQRMRCELAASLLHDPALLFLDEPTIGLDAVSKLAVRRFIRDVNRERGVTVILTTHDTADLEALTERILLLGRGKLLYDGALADIRSRYETERRLTLLFEGAPPAPALPGVRVEEWGEGRGVLALDTRAVSVSSVVAALGGALSLSDLSVASMPAEELIAAMYREYNL